MNAHPDSGRGRSVLKVNCTKDYLSFTSRRNSLRSPTINPIAPTEPAAAGFYTRSSIRIFKRDNCAMITVISSQASFRPYSVSSSNSSSRCSRVRSLSPRSPSRNAAKALDSAKKIPHHDSLHWPECDHA